MLLLLNSCAGVAKLVDAPDLGSGALGRVGSSPITRTILLGTSIVLASEVLSSFFRSHSNQS